ncbi:glycosyltransferase family 1 protein [Oceanimonas sp. CHS3-5]|uniref:glycosyltransferase family 1 protein n=1 Tax=Oceanimonas sp. CHS3-5 TaxID=3068186 RepID=UPI00273E3035|nr:glycosyltransferase family 1 protein [Oceanimonas sp. CHS3-5]MDP5292265.1 glycosyltransferase family 1 protein [Oceanimonas sp. CHS3-5]
MKVLVVEQGANPSTDFFIRPWAEDNQAQCEFMSLSSPPPAQQKWDLVVFVRYITPAWRAWLTNNKNHISRIALFMDDDLFSLKAHVHLPLRYRYKLFKYAWQQQFWLKRANCELWVSTPWLAKKYASWSPLVLTPSSPHRHQTPQKTLFYHGSASHQSELDWLYPVFEQVLMQDHSISVELIGNHNVRKQFATLPRIHVLHPMSWPAYQALLARTGRCIGLAPLLENAFNSARAPTKFFDITQAGAVGIYADHPVYRSVIKDGYNGLLLPMEQQTWADAILALSKNEEQRQAMQQQALDTHTSYPSS